MTRWQKFQEWLDSGAAILTCVAVMFLWGLFFLQPIVPFTVSIFVYIFVWICIDMRNQSAWSKRQYRLTNTH